MKHCKIYVSLRKDTITYNTVIYNKVIKWPAMNF